MIVAILIWVAVAFALIGAAGMWAMRDAYQRMHFLALPAGCSGPFLTLAILIADPQKQSALKVAFAALLLFAMNAVLTHATARAAWVRAHGGWPGKKP